MSDFEELDSFSESVLKDIIDHPHESSYWKEHFSDCSEAKKLWSVFGKLETGKYITYDPSDNFPAIIETLPRGETYFKNKEECLQKRKNEKRNKIVKKVLNYALCGIVSGIIITVVSEIIIRRIYT